MSSKRYLIVLLVVVVTLTLLLLGYALYRRLSPPTCGGYIDPTQRYCAEDGTMISGKTIPEETCNPMDEYARQELQLEFVSYMRRVQTSVQPRLRESIDAKYAGIADTYQGYMLFSIPSLLKILPSDFGQNEIAPYGVMSFFPTYLLRCLSSTDDDVCSLLFPNASPVVDVVCRTWVDSIKTLSPGLCPFDVNTSNPSLTIQDPRFFHLVGTLGAFSINQRQGVIMYIDLPVASLKLDYWSFTLYLGDRLKEDETCSPYRQTYLASLASPLSSYNVPAIAGKKMNALSGEGDVRVPGHVRGYIIVALDPSIAQSLIDLANERDDADFVHWMQIHPSKMIIDPSIPNPNRLTTDDPTYQPETDRISVFLRLSPSKDATADDVDRLRKFVQYEPPFQSSAVDLCFVDFQESVGTTNENDDGGGRHVLGPIAIPPKISEVDTLQRTRDEWIRGWTSSVYHDNYAIRRLALRSTLFNVFSPFTPSILNTTTIPYRGGWQAIQLAGCAQGDNPDAIYRLSEGTCMATDDVMLGVFVNHAFYGNCVYNNVNVLDLNKAFSFASVSLDRNSEAAFYVVAVGRSQDRLDRVEASVRPRLPTTVPVKYYSIFVPTDSTMEGGVPLCHQIMMVERVYVNTQYASLKDPVQRHSLHDVFGPDLRSVMEDADDDAWRSLVNVTAPDVTTLLPPVYFEIRYPSYRRQVFSVSLGLMTILLSVGMYRWIKSAKNLRPYRSLGWSHG